MTISSERTSQGASPNKAGGVLGLLTPVRHRALLLGVMPTTPCPKVKASNSKNSSKPPYLCACCCVLCGSHLWYSPSAQPACSRGLFLLCRQHDPRGSEEPLQRLYCSPGPRHPLLYSSSGYAKTSTSLQIQEHGLLSSLQFPYSSQIAWH